LQALQQLDMSDEKAVEEFKVKYYLDDEEITAMQKIKIPPVRTIQDYRSTYNDIRDWIRKEKAAVIKPIRLLTGTMWF
jgi:type I restriction enzyme R subunit